MKPQLSVKQALSILRSMKTDDANNLAALIRWLEAEATKANLMRDAAMQGEREAEAAYKAEVAAHAKSIKADKAEFTRMQKRVAFAIKTLQEVAGAEA